MPQLRGVDIVIVLRHLLVVCFLILSSAAFADIPPVIGNIEVTSATDFDDTLDPPNGICTLREADNNGNNRGRPNPDCASGGSALTIITFTEDRNGSPITTVTLNPLFGELSINAFITWHGPVTIANPLKGGLSRLVHVTGTGSLVADDVSLEGGIEKTASAGALLNEGSLTMNGGTVQNNRADRGGALALYGNTFLDGVEFLSNQANIEGGAIWVASSTELKMRSCSVHSNRTKNGPGSAIFAAFGNPTIEINETSFFGNRAVGSAGDGTFYGGGNVTITNSVFARNVTEGNRGGAGAFLTNGANATLVGDEFNGNSISTLMTSASGGGLFVDGGAVTVSKSNFIGNKAWVGGAVYAAPGTDLQIANTTLARNLADTAGKNSRADTGDGSAVYAQDANVSLIGTTIRDNTGRAQLASKGANANVVIENSIVWGVGSMYNCIGDGAFVSTGQGSFQKLDTGMFGSCPLPLQTMPEASVFVAPVKFTDPAGPPDVPLEHFIWAPAPGGPLLGGGIDYLCDDPAILNDEDEIGSVRHSCDTGAIEGF